MRRLRHELSAWADGFNAVAGMDEAGRGPLAGPVVAAAVCIPRDWLSKKYRTYFKGLDDSKKMIPTLRDLFFDKLTQPPEIRHGIGIASVEEIDRFNILQATHMAMRRALENLGPCVDLVLVDGLPVPHLPYASRAIVQGDAQSVSIAAASVIAKVHRDRLMQQYDLEYPGYGLAQHKGYGTPEHLAALGALGPCPIHRKSFRPVRQLDLELEA